MAKAKIEKEAPEQGLEAAPTKPGKLGILLLVATVCVLSVAAGGGVTFVLLRTEIAAMVQARPSSSLLSRGIRSCCRARK